MAKILIVDDDTTFCIMLRKWLEKRGFEVDTAFSYKDAVKQLDKAGFDLVLTDLRLPDKDGIDLLRVIKEKTPETQVLLMTGYADIQTAVTAIKLGAFDYVAKPVIPDEILKKLQEAWSCCQVYSCESENDELFLYKRSERGCRPAI
jgi:two-component system response regulator HydG